MASTRGRAKRVAAVAGLYLSIFVGQASGTAYIAANNVPMNSASYSGVEAAFLGTLSILDGDSFRGWFSVANGATVTMASGATATWECVGEFGGTLVFGTGGPKLFLRSDLWAAPSFALIGPAWFTTDPIYANPSIILSADLSLSDRLQLGDGMLINGSGHTVSLESSAYIGLDASATATLKNMTLCIKTTTPFSWGNASSRLGLENVTIKLDPSLGGSPVRLQTGGSAGSRPGNLAISGCVNIEGEGQTFDYNSDVTHSDRSASLLVRDGAILAIGKGVIFQMSTDCAGRAPRLYLEGGSSTLLLNDCTFVIPVAGQSNPGLQLERGTVIVDNRVMVQNEGNAVATQGLVLGDGASTSKDVAVKIRTGAQLVVDGFLYHKPA